MEQIHALTHWFVLMVHDPVKLMAQITVFPYVVMYSHDMVDERKQITATLIQHIDFVGFNYKYQRKIESQKGGWTINFQYVSLIKIL